MATKGPYGVQNPKKLPRWSVKSDPAPAVVSRGTVSRPGPLKKWNPSPDAANAVPKIVQK
jgi:hypothetical protein